jgi:hypothetical protein
VTATTGSGGLPLGTLSKLLIGLGVLLLAGGAGMIVLSIRRRRQRGPEPPPDVWYDSTISGVGRR